MIGNVQLLRGVAALTVAVGHTGLWIGSVNPVAVFFVISGFIMCLITEKDASGFFRRRLLRIAPFYWLCTFAYLVVMFRWPMLRPWSWDADFTQKFGRSIFFIAGDGLPLLGVGWTLNLEMYFYALLALALLISRSWAPAITAAMLLAVMSIRIAGCDLFVCRFYGSDQVEYFLAGIALFYAWRRIEIKLPWWPTMIVGSAAIVVAWFGVVPLFDMAPAFIVGCALLMATAGADLQWRAVLLLGDASYAIYLTHPIAIELLHRYHGETNAFMVLLLCLALGICAHRLVEKPLHRRLLAWGAPRTKDIIQADGAATIP